MRVNVILPDRLTQTPVTAAARNGRYQPWRGVLAEETAVTGDGRMLDAGSLRWDDDLPIALRWSREDNGAHQGAVTVGRILRVWRDGTLIRAEGDLDLDIPEAVTLAGLMDDPDGNGPSVNGVSVDLDDMDIEVRIAADVLEDMAGMMADEADGEVEEREVDDDGRVVVWEFASDDELFVTVDARIRAATVVDIPAINTARLELVHEPEALAASSASKVEVRSPGVPVTPPAAWFAPPDYATVDTDARLSHDPDLGITAAPIVITEHGRFFGHIAPWKTCHTGFKECVQPPPSAAGYRYFHVGSVVTDDGREVATGRVTFDTLHAPRRLSALDTLAHYEHTGMAVADVVAGEDQYGIWITGALRPGLTPEQLRGLRASPLSGDWRPIGTGLELVAILAVNSPGFPVPRPRAMVASSGKVMALQSAGIRPAAAPTLSDDDIAVLASMAASERGRRRAVAAGASRRILTAAAVDAIRED